MAGKSPGKLSAAKLKEAYLRDLRAAWELSRRMHADQTPYAFVLYGVEDPIRMHPVLLTEEGLDRTAAGYVKEGYHHTLDEARKALRWSIADSPYELELGGHIPTVDAMVSPYADALTRGGTYAPLVNAAIAALKDLDSQGEFGKGKERERLTLAILNFDTEEDWSAKSVNQLNPDAVVRRFRDETTLETEGAPANCTSLRVSRDGRSLYAAIWRDDSARTRRSQIVVYDLSGTHIAPRWAYTFPAHRPFPGPVACAPDDSFVLGLGAKGLASYDTVLVRLPRDSNVPTQQHEIEDMGTFALSPDGHRVAASIGKTLHL